MNYWRRMRLMKNFKFKQSWMLAGGLALLMGWQVSVAAESYLSEEDFYYEDIGAELDIYDPFERVNRVTFELNDFLYDYVMEPIATVYTTIAPDPVEVAATNFFDNLKYPVRLAGNLLQGRLRGAWVETGRFAINSTVGLAGIRRPADRIAAFAPIPAEDIGQAFGAWGIGEGPYLVLPLLGPSNVRDLGGLIADRAVNPLKEPYSLIRDWGWERELALEATEFIATSPSKLSLYNRLKGESIDPYSSMKNGFTQYRRSAVEE
ncbi:MAG: VacJ family lipoprotein [Puniceicoccaceae bacterium]|nr:MAG: VacJ family lipoprotein [Puniceicoccaceae bacterium]